MNDAQYNEIIDRIGKLEALIRSLKCMPLISDCTWKNGVQPYKCDFHPTTPWPGHRCPNAVAQTHPESTPTSTNHE
jgi:hypothetical protein